MRARPSERLEDLVSARLSPRRGRPCTAASRRCEFWTWGPDRERPACRTAHLVELMRFTHELLDCHGIVHWADYGSLLGAARDGRLIAWDSDVDLGIRAENLPRVRALSQEIEAAGHRLDASDPHVLASP